MIQNVAPGDNHYENDDIWSTVNIQFQFSVNNKARVNDIGLFVFTQLN